MRLATDNERVFITGKTGTGKTTEGLWQLSQRSIDVMPWIIIDFKKDDLVAQLPVTALVSIREPPPREPGLYVAGATWEDAEPRGGIDSYLLAILAQGRTGIFIDEGQVMGQRSRGLRMVLTQGRQPQVPVIFLTQRPVNVDTYTLSEANILQIFLLIHPDDHARVAGYVPPDRLDFNELRRLGDHHSFWYDVDKDDLEIAAPCPPFTDVYDRILLRLPRYEDAPAEQLPRRVRV